MGLTGMLAGSRLDAGSYLSFRYSICKTASLSVTALQQLPLIAVSNFIVRTAVHENTCVLLVHLYCLYRK